MVCDKIIRLLTRCLTELTEVKHLLQKEIPGTCKHQGVANALFFFAWKIACYTSDVLYPVPTHITGYPFAVFSNRLY